MHSERQTEIPSRRMASSACNEKWMPRERKLKTFLKFKFAIWDLNAKYHHRVNWLDKSIKSLMHCIRGIWWRANLNSLLLKLLGTSTTHERRAIRNKFSPFSLVHEIFILSWVIWVLLNFDMCRIVWTKIPFDSGEKRRLPAKPPPNFN